MKSRRSIALLIASAMAVASAASAQTNAGDLTFKVPLNLTRLSAEIAKVAVECRVESGAFGDQNGQPITGRLVTLKQEQEIAVTGGQVVTTANIVIPIPSLVNPGAYQANYGCSIRGITKAGQSGAFSATSPDPAFRLVPTPTVIFGSFAW